jgi:hypothetical protein
VRPVRTSTYRGHSREQADERGPYPAVAILVGTVDPRSPGRPRLHDLRTGDVARECPADERVGVPVPHAILRLQVVHDSHVPFKATARDDLLPQVRSAVHRQASAASGTIRAGQRTVMMGPCGCTWRPGSFRMVLPSLPGVKLCSAWACGQSAAASAPHRRTASPSLWIPAAHKDRAATVMD